MPALIRPPSPAEGDGYDRQTFHSTFDLHFDTLVAIGYVEGAYPISFGSTCTGFTGTDGEVAFREGNTKLNYGLDLIASTVYIVSTSASDTQVYALQGIDANGDYAETTVTATGTTPAAVAGTWNHVQRCICTTGPDNIGTVYVSTKSGAGVPTTTGNQIQTVMGVGENYAINSMLVVPNEQMVTFHGFEFFQNANQTATINIYAKRQGRWLLNFRFFGGRSDHTEVVFHTPVRFFEGDAMKVTVEAGGGTSADGSFGMNGNVWDVSGTKFPLDPDRMGVKEIFK